LTWRFLNIISEKKIILENDGSVVIENILMGGSQKTQSNNAYALKLLLPLNFKYTAFFLLKSYLTRSFIELCSSPNIILLIKSRRMRWAGLVARMGDRRGSYRALVEKPEGMRPLGRTRRRFEDSTMWIFRK
jgi:hypothetical protein